MEPGSPALADGFFTPEPPGKPFLLKWKLCHKPKRWSQMWCLGAAAREARLGGLGLGPLHGLELWGLGTTVGICAMVASPSGEATKEMSSRSFTVETTVIWM